MNLLPEYKAPLQDIEGYFASSHGYVSRLTKEGVYKTLKPFTDSRGNVTVKIRGVNYKVSRLIYYAFFSNTPKSYVIIHVNHDKTDNSLINLVAVSPENSRYYYD